jgi:exopolysaccharide biosynthesis polyprenyl glycosylphosphotransferase
MRSKMNAENYKTMPGMIKETEVVLSTPVAACTPDVRWQFLASSKMKSLLFVLADMASLLLAYLGARLAVHAWLRIPVEAQEPSSYGLFFLPFFAAVLYTLDGYGNADLRRPEKELGLLVKGISGAFLWLVAASFIFFKGHAFSSYLFACWYLLALALVICIRFGVRGVYAALWRRGYARQPAIFIGCPERLLKYQELLEIQGFQGYELLVLFPSGISHNQSPPSLPMFELLDQWEEIIARYKVQVVVVDQSASTELRDFAIRIRHRCRELRLGLEVFTELFNVSGERYELDEFTGCFRFSTQPPWSRQVQCACKYVLDRVMGVLGSAVTILIIPPIWLLLKLEDRGPLFYRSAYIGRDRQTQYYLKFRTMVANADDVLRNDPQMKARFAKNHKLRDDPRILHIGRFMRKYSIDEFPQFFSLLTGRLTLVGPRTIRQEEGLRYGTMLPKLLSVKSGLTGFWQVMGRQNTTYEERIQMDMLYIDHWSLWLDLVIIAKTFWKVLTAEGAY